MTTVSILANGTVNKNFERNVRKERKINWTPEKGWVDATPSYPTLRVALASRGNKKPAPVAIAIETDTAASTVLVRLARLQAGGVLYLFLEEDKVPRGSTCWRSGFQQEGDFVCYDTRGKYENEHWARDVPVVDGGLGTVSMTAYAHAIIDGRGNVIRLNPVLVNGCSLAVY